MNENAIKFAKYWRNVLADAELGKGAFESKDFNSFIKPSSELKQGKVDQKTITTCFSSENNSVQSIDVIVRPYIFSSQHVEHGKRSYLFPRYITPIIIHATLMRNGLLYPKKCHIPRDLLSPQDKNVFTIAKMDDYDKCLAEKTVVGFECEDENIDKSLNQNQCQHHDERWKEYLENCDGLYTKVTNNYLENNQHYKQNDYWWLSKKNIPTSICGHLIKLYDHMISYKPGLPHFDRVTTQKIEKAKDCISSSSTFSLRFAHASDQFCLSKSQRDALSHLMVSQDNDILAVNGPPGTGKTTLLLSVVSTLWAQAALKGEDPPLIIACSSNNKAVTNIIDAFGKDFSAGNGPMASRWLPKIKSFGSYFPSKSKKNSSNIEEYQTEDFFDEIESQKYVEKATDHYIALAKQAFPAEEELDLEGVISLLKEAIISESEKLKNIESAWYNLVQVRAKCSGYRDENLTGLKRAWDEAEKIVAEFKALFRKYKTYLAKEPLIYSLFSWLPAVSRKRCAIIENLLEEYCSSLNHSVLEYEVTSLAEFESTIEKNIKQYSDKAEVLSQKITLLESLAVEEKEATNRWLESLKILGTVDSAYTKTLEDIDEIVDTTIRFTIFQLTTHYWEGCWFREMHQLIDTDQLDQEKRKTGRQGMMRKWLRRMKITPCSVSTCYMLPGYMEVKKYNARGKNYVSDYLYNSIDLLVLDEAGQVLPEIAGALFSLSKKALVIGDTLQLEPIWSIAPHIDVGNLIESEIIPDEDTEKQYETISGLGKASSNGCVMKVAQLASHYHYDKDLERGMYLYEHRRCYDEIISYCNKLCYKGKLQPLRGKSPDNNLYPAIGYLHIDGKCQRNRQGSCYNQLEANIIAQWIKDNKDKIVQYYHGKPLSSVLAVVTPFNAQVTAIKSACREQGISVEFKYQNNAPVEKQEEAGITIGTTHALQGAEKPIVIFSCVYSKHLDGSFIDNKASSLNVAVSRAKDSFLAFGDMDLFEAAPCFKPRGLLAQYLFKNKQQCLDFSYPVIREDLATGKSNPYLLQNFEEHDDFLLKTLASASSEVQIFSPWINLVRIREIGAFSALVNCVQKNVNVTIYTDIELNTQSDNKQQQANKIKDFKEAKNILEHNGVRLQPVKKMHSKLLMCDDCIYCVGSFNWFSANRSEKYAKLEHSLVYQGEHIKNEINILKKALETRIVNNIDFETYQKPLQIG